MNDPQFDAARQRIDPAIVGKWFQTAPAMAPSPTAKRTSKRRRPFLRGPVPLGWLTRAAGLPGKALAVGMALWLLRGLQRRQTVRLTKKTLLRFSVSRKQGYAALRSLETAELVSVARHRGKSPEVTILLPGRRRDQAPPIAPTATDR